MVLNEFIERKCIQDTALAFDSGAMDSIPQKGKGWKVPKHELPSYLLRDPFLWRIFSRLNYEDKNFLGIVTGETGAGKSMTAITISRAVDIKPVGGGKAVSRFVVADDGNGVPVPNCRVVFGASQFIRLVKSGLPKGSMIVWDEAGVGNDATKWFDKKSQLVKHVMQTFRSRNYGVLLTVPDRESVAIGTRRLVHCYLDVNNREADHVDVHINWVQRVRKTGKHYEKCTVYINPETQRLTKVVNYRVPPPDKLIEKAYNRIKDSTLQNLYKFYQNEMEVMERELGLRDGGNVFDSEPEPKLKKFNMNSCFELCMNNLSLVVDNSNVPNKGRVALFLNKNGWEYNSTNVKMLTDLLSEQV